jgi:hypothetical protein
MEGSMNSAKLTMMVALVVASVGTNANAWDGSDSSTGEGVEIGSGELVRSGNSIEFYDSATGEYHHADVHDINRFGSTVEVELFDYTKGEHRTLEMED